MAKVKRTSEKLVEIVEKTQELNALLAQLPKSFKNQMATLNINQAVKFIVKNNH